MSQAGKLRLRQGLARLWLVHGNLARARQEGEALRALAATSDEPRSRAEAARLLAEIALEGGQLSDAETYLAEAEVAVGESDLPLIEWRIRLGGPDDGPQLCAPAARSGSAVSWRRTRAAV